MQIRRVNSRVILDVKITLPFYFALRYCSVQPRDRLSNEVEGKSFSLFDQQDLTHSHKI